MTDEEKATEISEKNRITYSHLSGESGTWFMSSEDECFCSALEMAEWKNKQFAEEKKRWINKVCNFLENRNVLEKDCSILASGICSITFHPDNLINDLKQVMEEQQ